MSTPVKFSDLGLSDITLAALNAKGFEEATPIQALCIPALLAGGKDILGLAQTGTGKTAAFGIPMIEKLDRHAPFPRAIVLAPTRELAVQVAEELNSLKGARDLNIVPIYGGQAYELQIRQLKRGVDIVVGTPGRVKDHIDRGTLRIDQVQYAILDEADEMLDMGFYDEVQSILGDTPKDKITLLFSATMAPRVAQIAKEQMREHVVLQAPRNSITAANTEQIYYEVHRENKFEALCRIIDIEARFYGIIFCRTKIEVDDTCRHLQERGYEAEALHGDISQPQREKILDKLRKGRCSILCATDVAARGIDVRDLSHVINYSLPTDAESYVHRIGRTGRAGRQGVAITFITPAEFSKLKRFTKEIKSDIKRQVIPKASQVVDARLARIYDELKPMLEKPADDRIISIARRLLEGSEDAAAVLASVLSHQYASKLVAVTGTEMAEPVRRKSADEREGPDQKGTCRVYLSRGAREGADEPGLVAFILEHCQVAAEAISDIEITDSASFVSLPFHDAEDFLESVKRSKGDRPYVKKVGGAPGKSDFGGGGGGGFNDRPFFNKGPRQDFGDRAPRGNFDERPAYKPAPRGDYEDRPSFPAPKAYKPKSFTKDHAAGTPFEDAKPKKTYAPKKKY